MRVAVGANPQEKTPYLTDKKSIQASSWCFWLTYGKNGYWTDKETWGSSACFCKLSSTAAHAGWNCRLGSLNRSVRRAYMVTVQYRGGEMERWRLTAKSRPGKC